MEHGLESGEHDSGANSPHPRKSRRRRTVAILAASLAVLLELVLSGPARATDSSTQVTATTAVGSGTETSSNTNTDGSTTTSSVPSTSTTTAAPASTTVPADTPGSSSAVAVADPGGGRAYLGAYLDPNDTPFPGTTAAEADQLSSFNVGLGRPLSLVQVGVSWQPAKAGAAAPVSMAFDFNSAYYEMSLLGRIAATGAIPVLSWQCDKVPDSTVSSGAADTVISGFAGQLRQLGVPVLVDFFPGPDDNSPASAACLGSDGPAGYVEAYRHVRSVFASAGATNVGFMWSLAGDGSDASSFYPGSGAVDWVGGIPTATQLTSPTTQLRAWYGNVVGLGKPLMVVGLGTGAANQSSYLQALPAAIAAMPEIRGVIYDDGPGLSVHHDFSTVLSTDGMARFRALSQLELFQPARRSTSVTLTVSYPTGPTGGTVTAAVSPSDGAGSLTFFSAGSPIAGCTDLPVLVSGNCDAVTLGAGLHSVTAEFSGDAQLANARSSAVTMRVVRVSTQLAKPRLPGRGHDYLGAWVNPVILPTGDSHLVGEMKALPSFEAQLAAPLSIVHVYQQWDNAFGDPNLFPTLRKIIATGSIPMIDWACGPSDAAVANGSDDAQISAFAARLAALKAPMFLRWYYEPNFPASADFKRCIGDAGPAGYQAAFRHIHDLFTAAGASNVAFVWALATSGADPDPGLYYPGDAYVDWIAADGYFPHGQTVTAQDFADRFGAWYSQYAGQGKPLMISETGTGQGFQGAYLQMLSSLLPSQYPAIRALVYFDAPGAVNFALDADGMAAMQALATASYFQPDRKPASIAVNMSPNPAHPGQTVRLASSLVDQDFGGSVTYTVDGLVPSGCSALPVVDGAISCAVTLAPGPHVVTASFSGDTLYSATAASPLDVATDGGSSNQPPPFLGGPGSSSAGYGWSNVTVSTVPPLQYVAPPAVPSLETPTGTAVDPSVAAASGSGATALSATGAPGTDWGFPQLLSGDHPLMNAVVLVLMLIGLVLGVYILNSWARTRRMAVAPAHLPNDHLPNDRLPNDRLPNDRLPNDKDQQP